MSIVIIFGNRNPAPWQESLQKKIANTAIEIHPAVIDKSAIRFAVCWKAEKDALRDYPNVEVIQSVGAGVEHVLSLHHLHDKINICRLVDTHLSQDMWHYVLLAVLANLRDFPTYFQNQLQKEWKPTQYSALPEKVIGIMGLGEIGGYVAEKFSEMGFTVCGWSRSQKNISGVTCYAGDTALDEFLGEVNILVNILPLTTATKGILNKRNLLKLKTNAYVINVGRGDHLVEEDLIELLDTAHLSGALLDVFKIEPLPKDHPFWSHPKIQITPHVASETNLDSATDLIVENYNRMVEGKGLLHSVSEINGY